MFHSEGFTDKGLNRDNNEDMILIKDNIFVVSDGMGGHEKGEVASRMVIDSIKRINYSDIEVTDDFYLYIREILNSSIMEAHKNITRFAIKSNIKTIMGATVAGIYESNLFTDTIAIFHLGDSRVYRIRDGHISQRTIDHSQYEDMRRSGQYSQEELDLVGKNMITKAVGNFSFSSLEITFEKYKKDDIYIICSDGVSDLCSDIELETIINSTDDLKIACQMVKDMVYSKGAKDNLSLILLKAD
jgi:protein phosphatase